VKSLHTQMDAVLRRLGRSNTKAANALRAQLTHLRQDTQCPQNMALDLSS